MEESYKNAFNSIGSGVMTLLRLMPKTFVRQTAKLIMNHPIYLTFLFVVIGTEGYTIAKERVQRDADSRQIYLLQHRLDSIEGKVVRYFSYAE